MTHEQLPQHHLFEGGVDLSGQKSLQLDQQSWAHVLVFELLVPDVLAFVWQMLTSMMARVLPHQVWTQRSGTITTAEV